VARVKRSVHSKKHRRAVLQEARGYYGNKSRSFRAANEQVMHSLQYAYRDRRARKGDFRKLWIQRINAAAREHGVSYSRLIAGLHQAEIEVDRKVLADLAVREPAVFASIVRRAMGERAPSDVAPGSTEAEVEPTASLAGAGASVSEDVLEAPEDPTDEGVDDEEAEEVVEDEAATAR
jgi:large subunit ribosomal protein L20